jgi:hypothetical protein
MTAKPVDLNFIQSRLTLATQPIPTSSGISVTKPSASVIRGLEACP